MKAAICFAANFLAQSPEHRRQLIAEPALIPHAAEELFRRFGGPNLARVVRRDLGYKGVTFRGGEMVLLPFPLAGLDDDANADPLTVDFKRSRIKHLDFGAGPHTCVGAALARTEMMIFLEEWLRKIPDFEIKAGGELKCVTGLVNIPIELSLRWHVAA